MNTDLDQLRSYLSSVISMADNDTVPDGYADGLDEDSEHVSDWSTYIADKVLAALSDGGLPADKIAAMLNHPEKFK